MTITLEQSRTVVDEALAEARRLDAAPLTVAVLDPGGHLVALQREDGSGILRPQIAVGKAWGALGMGIPSRALARRANQLPEFFAAVASLEGAALIPVPGGVLVRDGEGALVGAVGVSGDISDRDEECAVAGIAAAGLTADTGERG